MIFFLLLLTAAFTPCALAQSTLSASLLESKLPFTTHPISGLTEIPAQKTAIHEPIIDSQYIVGPGDVLKVTYFGNVLDEEFNTTVDPEGNLVIPKMGLISANKSLREVKDAIIALVKSKTKNVEIVVQLSTLKPTIIPVAGEVVFPGSYEFSSTVRLGEVLTRAFMIKDSSFRYSNKTSLRNVTVYNAKGMAKEYDFENYLLNSDISGNPFLFSGDRVLVLPKKNDLFITGAIVRPKTYCYKKESLFDFIRFAGGLKENADSSSISVTSYTSDGYSVEMKKFRYPDECRSYILKPEDYVVVGAKPYWQDQMQVTITGRVKNPGTYLLKKGATIAELFEKAGGKLDDADIYVAYLNRTKYFDNLSPATFKSGMNDYMLASASIPHIDIEESLFQKDSNSKTLLQDGDILFIPRMIPFVSVVGNVCSPGLVDYKKGDAWKDYVNKAGGFDAKASEANTRIFKKGKGAWILAKSAEGVEAGDVIVVPALPDEYYWNKLKDIVTITSGLLSASLVIWTVTSQNQ